MGAIAGLVGGGGGAAGTSFAGPQNSSQQGAQDMQQVYQQLQGIYSGTGPNPAQAQYFQNVQDLAKQQSGAIGSIQGISPALAARMQTQQGSAALQNAAAAGGANLASQQVGALQAAGSIGASQQNATNAMQSNVNSANAGLANTQMQGQQGLIGGTLQGVGSALSLARGGMVQRFADGGAALPGDSLFAPISPAAGTSGVSGPQSMFGKFVKGATSAAPNTSAVPGIPAAQTGPGAMRQGAASAVSGIIGAIKGKPAAATDPNAPSPFIDPGSQGIADQEKAADFLDAPAMAKGGPVKAMVSPGERIIPPGKVKAVANGEPVENASKKVPGKPKVAGNSYKNDTVPAKLPVGSIVIPNSVMQSEDPAAGAHDFVSRIMAKRRAAS